MEVLVSTPVGDLGRVVPVLERSRELGFLGPGAVDAHIVHARAFLEALAPAGTVLDLGSGGGVPGLVLAVAHPDRPMVLLDAHRRRTDFLRDAVAELGLDQVSVLNGRAEELARDAQWRERMGVVVARSFGAPAVLAECARGFLVPGGQLLVSEPPDEAVTDARWPEAPLAGLGLVRGQRWITSGSTIQELRSVGGCPDEVPRRVGVPGRRPLYR
jgi:16S rRNA (guanine527-N7)-methyltransferase